MTTDQKVGIAELAVSMAAVLSPTRNNQSAGINWAKDFEFAATLGVLGAVAQLGERRDGIAEATGSSPVGSITR
jgi:hypothetical protein